VAEDSGKTAGNWRAAKSAAGASPAKNSSGALPNLESPPLSPAEEAAAHREPALGPTDLIIFRPEATSRRPPPRFKPSHRRNAIMAASVLVAASLGTFIGLLTGLGLAEQKKPTTNLAANRAARATIQHSIARLDKDISTLKASLAAAQKSAHSEIAKLTERLDSAPEITGSIPPPPQTVVAPMPLARPAIAAATHAPLVRGWVIRFVQHGYVYVQGRGDIYEVAIGAPLPGLGPVQEIKRQDGRWLVVTPKGLIVARRDRRFFEQF
jgi:hypothetical protein